MSWEEFIELVEFIVQYDLDLDDLDEVVPTRKFANFCEDIMGMELADNMLSELNGIVILFRAQEENGYGVQLST